LSSPKRLMLLLLCLLLLLLLLLLEHKLSRLLCYRSLTLRLLLVKVNLLLLCVV
jgi:hypothetical protein